MKKTIALIEKGKDESFGIFTPDLQHTIIGNGGTVREAKEDFWNSFKEVLASYTEMDKAIPTELQEIEFEFRYDIASLRPPSLPPSLPACIMSCVTATGERRSHGGQMLVK